MNAERRAPTSWQVVAAIGRREVMVALRRRLVKLLFLGNLVPPLVMGVILVVNMAIRQSGLGDLGWDPLLRLIQIQAAPVLLVCLGIGAPLVARDRNEDVLFLYATRPVTPWSYTLGKMIAVAFPAASLLIIPCILIAILRQGLLEEFQLLDSITLVGKITLAAVLLAWGYAGVAVGSSAATRKARWALLLAIACLSIPSGVSEIIWGRDAYALDATAGMEDLLDALFQVGWGAYATVGVITLLTWGWLGAWVTSARVRREMTP